MNPYSLFMNLLPKDSKIIAKITYVGIDGTVRAEIPGSSTEVTVRGDGSDTYSVGDHVFIVNGIISGKTPALQTILEVEVV